MSTSACSPLVPRMNRLVALPALPLVAPATRLAQAPRRVLSNSFAFGGSNAVLVFGEG